MTEFLFRLIIDPKKGGNKITKYLASQVTCCFMGMFCPDSFRKTVLIFDKRILILQGGGYKVQHVGVYKVQQVRVYKVSLFSGSGSGCL